MSDGATTFPPADGEPWAAAIAALAAELERTFGALIERCRADATALSRRSDSASTSGPWSGLEVLEHVALTDRFLLLLADKIADRCRRRLARGLPWPTSVARFELLLPLTDRAFTWTAPAHMRPTGGVTPTACGEALARDLGRCRALLAEFPAGEGTLHRIRMSVVDERLDLYQYLALVALHARRHLGQLERALAPRA